MANPPPQKDPNERRADVYLLRPGGDRPSEDKPVGAEPTRSDVPWGWKVALQFLLIVALLLAWYVIADALPNHLDVSYVFTVGMLGDAGRLTDAAQLFALFSPRAVLSATFSLSVAVQVYRTMSFLSRDR